MPLTDDNSIIKDVLWGMYTEHCTQARHHETQRTAVTNIVIAVGAAIVGVVTFDKKLDSSDLVLTLFLTLIGLFGAAFTTKHYERFSLHMERARQYRDRLDALLLGGEIGKLKDAADTKHEEEFSKLHQWHLKKWRLHELWLAMHLLIALLGLVLSAVALFSPQSGG